MNKFLTLGLAVALTAGLATSCKDDVLNGGEDLVNSGNSYADDGIRMYVCGTLSLPTAAGTRSATEGEKEDGSDINGDTNSDIDKSKDENGQNYPDYEMGHDYENNIKAVLLVFADSNKDYVAHSVVTGISKTPNLTKDMAYTDGYDLEVIGEIKHSHLVKAYEGSLQGKTDPIVYVYAFCNPTSRMLDRFESLGNGQEETTKWYDWEGVVEEDPSPAGFTPLTQNSIWAKESFLMASAEERTVKFPSTIGEWDEYADKDNPFFVGERQEGEKNATVLMPIPVERVAARLDFKDGSTKWSEFNGGKPNTYPIFVDSNRDNIVGNAGDLNIISVQLNRMCLVNMSKNYFYLRRVTGAGGSNANSTLLGLEHSKNYIVDYDWAAKGGTIKADTKENYNEDVYFNFPLYTFDKTQDDDSEGLKYNRFNWYTDRIQEDFLNPSDDNNKHDDDTWNIGGDAGSGYKIWRYVTENTLPSEASQQTLQSTGIVFKGRIVVGKDITDPKASDYMSQNVINAIQYINGEEITVDDETIKFDRDKANLTTELTEDQEKYAPYLYSFNNILYAGHEELIAAGNKDGNNGSLHHAVNQVLKNWKYDAATHKYTYKATAGVDEPSATADEYFSIEAWVNIINDKAFPDGQKRTYEINRTDFLEECASAGFSVYRPYNEKETDVDGNPIGDGWGYYCYYFYWNRHNDNSKSGLMGNMEFATVRNNVYKLYVDQISQLGHPRHRSYDPDPVEPNDPDEDPFNYIKVEVKVLPWVVRENKITF